MSRKTLKDNGQLHSPAMACYYAVHNYQGGLPVIAALMPQDPPMIPGTLQKKLSPNCFTHKLSLDEAMHILRFTENTAILDSICSEVNMVWYAPDEVPEFCGDLDLVASHSNLFSRTSDLVKGVSDALADGVIDEDEQAMLKKLKLEMLKAIKQVDEVSAQFEG